MQSHARPHSSQPPLLSIIIAVYNKPDFLEKVLLSLVNQSLKNFEVVIADDGSNNTIHEVVNRFSSRFSYPINHQRHEDNGFRKTIIANKATMAAKADYLVFIDGDCILHHRFLETHAKYRKHHTVLAGRRVMLDQTISEEISNSDITSGRFEKQKFWRNHCPKKDRKHGLYISYIMLMENFLKKKYSMYGSNFSLYKNDFCAVNGYDERIIGRGHEDDNLRERLKLNGMKIISITREALQFHLYHSFDPVPHSIEDVATFCYPEQAWTDYGIIKKSV